MRFLGLDWRDYAEDGYDQKRKTHARSCEPQKLATHGDECVSGAKVARSTDDD